jgi:hypothetical protein
MRVGELRDDEGVDPLTVGGAVDLGSDRGLEMRREKRLHLGEPCQIAVVRQHQRDIPEVERVAVLQRDLDARVIGHAADMGEEAAGADFLGEVL